MARRMGFATRSPVDDPMSRHRFSRSSRRLHHGVLASYLLVLAVAMLSPWLGDAPLAPLCRGAGSVWAAATPAGDGPDGRTLDCAACLPLQLTATAATALQSPALGPDLARPPRPTPFIDPLRVALPPARGPPLV